MTESSVGRRNVLRSAGMAAGGAALGGVALGAPAVAAERRGGRDVSGSWRVNVHNDDGEESVSILSFAAGDVCVVHDISPAGPPFTGTWREGRHDSFRATVLTGTPGDGPGSPGAIIELKLRGSVRRQRISGSFTFRVRDAAGAELAAGSGTFDGKRVEA
jgi:hypothetical protein